MCVLLCVIFLSSIVGAAEERDSRIFRVERWLKAVAHHEPEAIDDPLVEIAGWSNSDLRILWRDSVALRQLMRDPGRSWFTVPASGQRPSQPAGFTPRQLDGLRVLACAAAGIAGTDRVCLQINARAQMDDDLRQLARLAADSRTRGDPDYVLRRAALLHTDIATTSNTGEPLAGTPASSDLFAPQRLKIDIADGRGASAELATLHWDIARAVLDDLRRTDAATVRLWYRATAAWMQAAGHHDSDHLGHGLQLFPNDPDLLFLGGCEHEALARPAIQAVVRAAVVPAGFELEVGSDAAERREAEGFFRRALSLAPDHAEARLRLGRVLLLRGRAREAADEIRRATGGTEEPLLQYFASMFLGAAEDALGHDAAADAWYRAASELYPKAQSPHFARSALARRRGEREAALTSIERAFQLAAAYPDGDDPWWSYTNIQGRNAEDLLDEARRLLLERQR